MEAPEDSLKLPQGCRTSAENVPPEYSYVKKARETKYVLKGNYLTPVYVFSELDYTIKIQRERKPKQQQQHHTTTKQNIHFSISIKAKMLYLL